GEGIGKGSAFGKRRRYLIFAALDEGLGDGARIGELELAADRYAPRNATDLDTAGTQQFGDVVRSRFTFVGEVGGHDDLLDQAVAGAADQALEVQFARPDAVERRQASHQHIVEAVVGMGLLHDIHVYGHLDHAELLAVALGRGAARAHLILGKGI